MQGADKQQSSFAKEAGSMERENTGAEASVEGNGLSREQERQSSGLDSWGSFAEPEEVERCVRNQNYLGLKPHLPTTASLIRLLQR